MTEIDMVDIKPPLNINETCRTCLSRNGDMLSIFETIENEPLNVKLSDISQIQVVNDDGLPSLICEVCVKLTNSAFAFKQQVKKIDAVLKQFRETKRELNASDSESDICGKYLDVQLHHIENQPNPVKIEEICLIPNYEDQSLRDCDSDYLSNDLINSIKQNPIDIANEVEISVCEYKEIEFTPQTRNNSTYKRRKRDLSKKIHNLGKTIKKHRVVNLCALCSEPCDSESILIKHMKSIHNINKPFTCDYCQCSFTGKHSLEVHISIKHTKERKFACDSCPKTFIEKRDLNRHKSGHTKPFVCEICDKGFSFRQSLSIHMNMHRRSPGKHPCPKCQLLFMDQYQLQRHTKVAHTGEIHECQECHKTFSHKSRLKKHLMSHKNPNDRRWECKFCSRKFNYLHHLINHERIHTGSKPFLCNKCGKNFAQSHNLTLHLRHHESVLPHECNICVKRFAHPQLLRRHMKTHSGKPYLCKICPKSYTEIASLKRHIKSCHDNSIDADYKSDVVGGECENKSSDKKFTCKICAEVFTTVNYLKIHNRSHKDKHVCNVCDRKFALASVLKAHLQTHSDVDRSHVCKECGTGYKRLDHLKAHHRRIHSKERPFHCTHCSRSFYQNSELTVHLRRHKGEKPYTCKICNKSFVTLTALKIHERTHSGTKATCNSKKEQKINNVMNTALPIAIDNAPCDMTTKNIIFVNDNVIETYGDLSNLINDNQTYLESDGTNLYLTNIIAQNNVNAETIKSDKDVIKSNVDMNVPTFNVIRSQDGKLLLQLTENLRFSVNDGVAQPHDPKLSGESFIDISGSAQQLTSIHQLIGTQNSDGQNITIVSGKGDNNETICFPANATIVYAQQQQSQDAVNTNTDMPSL